MHDAPAFATADGIDIGCAPSDAAAFHVMEEYAELVAIMEDRLDLVLEAEEGMEVIEP